MGLKGQGHEIWGFGHKPRIGVGNFHRDVWKAAAWGFELLQGKSQIEASVNLGLGD